MVDAIHRPRKAALLFPLLASVACGAALAPREDVPVQVREFLHTVAERYRAAIAFSQVGVVTIDVEPQGGPPKTATGDTYVALVRPLDFLVRYGHTAMVGDENMRLFYDFTTERIYTIPRPKPGSVLKTVDTGGAVAAPDPYPLAVVMDRALMRDIGREAAAETIGGAVADLAFSFLVDDTPLDDLLKGVSSAELRERGVDSRTILLNYQSGRTTEIEIVDGWIRSMTLHFGREELTKLSEPGMALERLVVRWQSEEILSDPEKVAQSLRQQRKILDSRTSGYQRRNAAGLEGVRVSVPTPPNREGLLSYLKYWIKSL